MHRRRTGSAGELRVVFAGGGTGGHVMPGAATATALRELTPGARCLFLCTSSRAERHCRPALAEFETFELPAARWGGAVQKCRFAAAALAAAERCLNLLASFRPHALIGLGGYACVAPVLVARAMRVPTMLLEANAIPGRVVRTLAPVVDCVQLPWALAACRLRARRALVTGTPVRREIFQGDRSSTRARLGLAPGLTTLLVIGGSQGARSLNRLLAAALPLLAGVVGRPMWQSLQVLHLTGPAHLEEVLGTPRPAGLIYRAIGFTSRMRDAYAAADVVLARAGGSTLAELTALGIPSILVPYPHAADDHQSANAGVLARAGAAVAVAEAELDAERLAQILASLVNSPGRRDAMAERAHALGRPDAAAAVAIEVAALAGVRTTPHDGEPRPHCRPQDLKATSFPKAA